LTYNAKLHRASDKPLIFLGNDGGKTVFHIIMICSNIITQNRIRQTKNPAPHLIFIKN
jgi:hypothetical protein